MTATVPGPTDIYLAGQPDGATVTWNCEPFVGWTSTAPQHSPVMVDISSFAGKELALTATGVIGTGGHNGSYPDGQNYGLRVNCLSQVNGLTRMYGFKQGGLVGVFLTDSPPMSGLLPYMSTSGIVTDTPLLQHIFFIGSSRQVVVPERAARLFFGVAEQQGLIKDNSGAYDVTVVAVPHALLPSDPFLATRFYTGDPNDSKDGIRRAALPSDGSPTANGPSIMTSTGWPTSRPPSGQRRQGRFAVDLPVVGAFNGDGRSRDRRDDAVRRRQHVDARYQRQRCIQRR